MNSLASRITFTCILLVLVSAAGLMWFAHTGTLQTLRMVERRSLDNILYLVEHELTLTRSFVAEGEEHFFASVKEELRVTAESALETLALHAPEGEFARQAAIVEEIRPQLSSPLALLLFRREGQGSATVFHDEKGTACPWLDQVFLSLPPAGRFGLIDLPLALFPSVPPTQPMQNEKGGQGEEKPLAGQGNTAISGYSHIAFFLPVPGGNMLAALAPVSAIEQESVRQRAFVEQALMDMLKNIRIQETGSVVVLDSQGGVLGASVGGKALPSEVVEAIIDPHMLSKMRRVMVYPGDNGEVLYIVSFFRPYNWHIVIAAPLNELEAPAFVLMESQILITMGVSAVAILVGLALSQIVASPVRKLTRFARELPTKDLLTVEPAELLKEMPRVRGGEVAALASSFGFMVESLGKRMRELVSITKERERFESELSVARDIQFGMLPMPLAESAEIELAALMIPAKEVGGDLYDYFWLDDKLLCFAIGDVSDKGVPAALFMSMTISLSRVKLKDGLLSVGEAMRALNDILSNDNPRNMFVTLILGIIDVRTGHMQWASGGHPPPLLVRSGEKTNEVQTLEASGDMVIGGFDGLPFKTLSVNLEPGDILLFYTDGVTEAVNTDLAMYTEEQLGDFVAKTEFFSVAELIGDVEADVHRHADGAQQSDDITMLALRWWGRNAAHE